MTLVVDKFRTLLPPRTKTSPSGWLSFNAPCCHHRGHKPDTRKRAGIRFDGEGIVYNCFNCKFSTGWQPGLPFGEKIKTLSRWLGAGEDIINEMIFESLKTDRPIHKEDQRLILDFVDKHLPENSMLLKDWADLLSLPAEDELKQKFIDVIGYIENRGFDPFDHDFYWCPEPGYDDRVIVPFLWQGRIVGNTARKITDGKTKYLSDQQPNFVFNFDRQRENQKYCLVTEGPFDALAVEGVALLTNDISDQQSRIINSIGSEVIVIPDQDRAGLNLFDRATELNWSVAMPNWDDDIKDCADAVKKYGKLYVVVDAIMSAQKGPIKIAMAKKRLSQQLEIRNEKNN
jgi:hypothetical protein